MLVELHACAASSTCVIAELMCGNSERRSILTNLVSVSDDKGLGELYEEEYVKAAKPDGDVLEERDAATKAEARTLLKVGLGFQGLAGPPCWRWARPFGVERAASLRVCWSMLSMSAAGVHYRPMCWHHARRVSHPC
jgi:hypothetical protein